MNEAQALQFLDSVAKEMTMKRDPHDMAKQAIQILARSLQELAELRQQAGQRQQSQEGEDET